MKKRFKYLLLEIASPFIAILFAVLIGALVMLVIDKNPVEVYRTMFLFSFKRLDSVAIILFGMTPLIFSGLAVAIGFKAGLFNIGIEGQYLIGTFLAALAGFALKGLPTFIHLPLVILMGMLGGMLWAWLPIYLKVKRGVHEVISTIMLNYVSFSLIHYLIADVFMDKQQGLAPGVGNPIIRLPKIAATAVMPKMHSFLSNFGINLPQHVYLNWFLVLALLMAVGYYFLVWRTPFGYELRAVGHNPAGAETAGIKPGAVFFKAFLLSGAIAGLTGLSDLLSYFGYMDLDFPRGYGFTGIAVALIGKNGPLGIVLAAFLFAFLNRGAEGVQAFVGVPMETIVILQGVMILSIVVFSSVMGRYIRQQEKKEAALGSAAGKPGVTVGAQGGVK